MWWGDLVTPRDWTDLWLNEGFATYFEALYTEATRGKDEFQYEMILASSASRNADRLQGRKPIVSAGSHLVNVYSRGAWVLHMLRDILGEDAFMRGLRHYLKKYQYANAETAELKLALEDATGQNLDWFFRQWLFGAGCPRLKAATSWDSSAHTLQITVEQRQETDSLTGIFRFPLTVECTTASGATTRRFWIERQSQTITLPVYSQPLMVILDKGYHVLKELTFLKSPEEYRYQLRLAEDVADRITAARGLGDLGDDVLNRVALATAAREDQFWGVREAALVALGECPPDSVRGIMLEASHDPHSRVRYAAAYQLSQYHDGETRQRLEEMARFDCSYLVASGSLRNLASIDTARAFDVARVLIKRESYRNLLRLASLAALKTSRDPRALAVALPYTSPKYDDATRKEAIELLGELGADSATARAALRRTLNDRLPGIRSGSVRAVAGWNDPEFTDLLRAMAAKEKDQEVLDALRKAEVTPQD
jgi:aminopeptidase N